jgi:hypothetical protein
VMRPCVRDGAPRWITARRGIRQPRARVRTHARARRSVGYYVRFFTGVCAWRSRRQLSSQ